MKSSVRQLFSPFKIVSLAFRFFKAFSIFEKTGKTSTYGYMALRELYVLTNGRFNDFVSWLLSHRHPRTSEIVPCGILGDLSQDDVGAIAHRIRKDGYCIATQKLDQATIDKIVTFAQNTPAAYLDLSLEKPALSERKIQFSAHDPVSPIYKFDMEQIFQNHALLALILDQSLLAVAQAYLGCRPILDLVSLWWSVPFGGKGLSAAAQKFHFDMDRIKFLKVFIYLNDVDTDTGPHCYVKGSHKLKPKALLSDGRKSDDAINGYYSDKVTELHGTRGTIIFVDTRGFHKGKPVVNGHRLIFQLEYCNHYFGQTYPKVRVENLSTWANLQQRIEQYPQTYDQILDFSKQ